MKLIREKKFIVTTLSPNKKIFAIYVVAPGLNPEIYPLYRLWLVALLINNTFTIVIFKYTDFANNFYPEFIAKLSKHTTINNLLINLILWLQRNGFNLGDFERIQNLGRKKKEGKLDELRKRYLCTANINTIVNKYMTLNLTSVILNN